MKKPNTNQTKNKLPKQTAHANAAEDQQKVFRSRPKTNLQNNAPNSPTIICINLLIDLQTLKYLWNNQQSNLTGDKLCLRNENPLNKKSQLRMRVV